VRCFGVAGGQAANENITIQNNTIRDNANEGILFHYDQ
jgi:parallel beta-helix repeat protein